MFEYIVIELEKWRRKGDWKLCVYSLCCPVSFWAVLLCDQEFIAFLQQTLISICKASLRVHLLTPKETHLSLAGVLVVVMGSLVLVLFYSTWQFWCLHHHPSLIYSPHGIQSNPFIMDLRYSLIPPVTSHLPWNLISGSHYNLQTLQDLVSVIFSFLIPTFLWMTAYLAHTGFIAASWASHICSCFTAFVLCTRNSCPHILAGPSLYSALCFCVTSSEIQP